MSTIIRRLRSAARVARRDPGLAWLAARCFVLLVIMRGVITVLPLRRISRHLGSPMEETTTADLDEGTMRYTRRVAWCISKVAPFTPTTSNCYPQGLTARYLLHRRRIPSTIYYGAAFDRAGSDLVTHVWVRVGSFVVTGAPVHRRFAVVSKFADYGPEGRDAADAIHAASLRDAPASE